MKHSNPTHSDAINGHPHGTPRCSGRRIKATLLGLAIALAIPSALGCSGGGVRWARAHAVQDGATAASHTVARALASLDKPATAAPVAAGTKEAATKTGESRSGATEVSRPTTEPEADLNAALGVKRLVVAHGVKGREPVSPTAAFSKGTKRIYAFVEVSNPERAESAVFVSFVREGERERGGVRLRVGESPRWRTWAYTRLADKPGRYVAMVRDGQGKLLAKAPFEVKAKEGAAAVGDGDSAASQAAAAGMAAPAEDKRAAVGRKSAPQI